MHTHAQATVIISKANFTIHSCEASEVGRRQMSRGEAKRKYSAKFNMMQMRNKFHLWQPIKSKAYGKCFSWSDSPLRPANHWAARMIHWISSLHPLYSFCLHVSPAWLWFEYSNTRLIQLCWFRMLYAWMYVLVDPWVCVGLCLCMF